MKAPCLFRQVAVFAILAQVPVGFAQTGGSASLKAVLHDYTGSSNDDHWTVAWVTDGSGAFIKTLWIQGPAISSSKWTSHCAAWTTAKAGSTAFDGFSSATARDYAGSIASPDANNPVDPVWDGRDAAGNLVPDGNYRFYIQYAEDAGQGPSTTVPLTWTKGPAPFSQGYAAQGTTGISAGSNNFTDLSVLWTPFAPEIAIEQPVGVELADGGARDFGVVTLGSSASLSFLIKNTGNSDLTGLSVSLDGSHPGDFAVTSPPVAPVAGPAGTTGLVLRFTPTAAGPRTAALHLASNDLDESSFDLILNGTGLSAFDAWTGAAGLPEGQSGPDQTPQDDGVANLLKFAFNLDPTRPDPRLLHFGAGDLAGLPGAAMVGGKLRLEFLRRKQVTTPGILYIPQFCGDLATWADFSGPALQIDSVDPVWERVLVEDPQPAGAAARFGRLKIVQTP